MSREYVTPNEFLQNNILDEDLQSMLLPLNLMQSVMLLSKFNIRDNFITPNTFYYNTISFMGMLFFVLVHSGRLVIVSYTEFYDQSKLYYTLFCDFFIYIIGFVIIFIANLIQNKNNVKLILKIRDICRVVNITKDENFKRFTTWNWINIISLFLFYALIFIFNMIYNEWITYDIFIMISLFYFDVNIVYAIRIIKFLTYQLTLWTSEIEYSSKACSDDLGNTNEREMHWKKLFQCYLDILEAFDYFKKTFQVMILFYVTECFFHVLLYVMIVLDGFKDVKPMIALIYSLLAVFTWTVKNMVLQIILSMECEKFYIAVADAEAVCVVILMTKKCSNKEYQLCKNVRRMNRTSFSRLRVCGLFVMDARLPLRLIGLVAAYTIVLLQFALL